MFFCRAGMKFGLMFGGMVGPVRKTPLFAPFMYYKNRSFYQDRLGTNTGKVEKRGACFAGVNGVPLACKQKRRYDPVTPMRLMEAFIRRVGGYSFLYADTFLTRDELREMFDHSLCDASRPPARPHTRPPAHDNRRR